MKFILAKKLDMSQVWEGEKVVAVTRVKVENNFVVQVKTEENDGYSGVQIGFGEKKEKNVAKPQRGHNKGLQNFRYLKEFRIESGQDLKRGNVIDIESFEKGDIVKVTSVSKGKGFQGVVKKYKFAGQTTTHGTKDQVRMPGSIGATGPAHVFKGTRMPGRMGGEQVTISNLEIVKVDKENGIILIKGGIPGARNQMVQIYNGGELKIEEAGNDKDDAQSPKDKPKEKKIAEDVVEEDLKEEKK